GAGGSVTVSRRVRVPERGGGNRGPGGTITMEAGRDVSASSVTLNVPGQSGGAGGIGIDARGGVTLGGTLAATGLVKQANGGSISITAGGGGFGPGALSGPGHARAGGGSSGGCRHRENPHHPGCGPAGHPTRP